MVRRIGGQSSIDTEGGKVETRKRNIPARMGSLKYGISLPTEHELTETKRREEREKCGKRRRHPEHEDLLVPDWEVLKTRPETSLAGWSHIPKKATIANRLKQYN